MFCVKKGEYKNVPSFKQSSTLLKHGLNPEQWESFTFWLVDPSQHSLGFKNSAQYKMSYLARTQH